MVVKDDVSTNWKLFRQSWQYYVTATELNKKWKEVQAGALCSVMGMECVKVMNSLTTLTVDDKKDPEKILSALGDHFMPQKHLLFERVKFGFANQAEHETIDQYVVRLRQLAESCGFEGLCESLIRDRLVIGTRDSSTRDKLLRERPVPGLTRCIEALRASELSRIHKDQLKDEVPDSRNIVHVADKKPKRNRRGHGKKSKQGHQDKMSPRVPCKFCGTNHPYDRSKCPASGKTCLKCGKQGHFAVKCQEKKRARVLQPTKYIKQAQHKNMQMKATARQNVNQKPSLMIPSLSLNELEWLIVMLAVHLSWYHLCFIPSMHLLSQLSWTLGQRAVQCLTMTSLTYCRTGMSSWGPLVER